MSCGQGKQLMDVCMHRCWGAASSSGARLEQLVPQDRRGLDVVPQQAHQLIQQLCGEETGRSIQCLQEPHGVPEGRRPAAAGCRQHPAPAARHPGSPEATGKVSTRTSRLLPSSSFSNMAKNMSCPSCHTRNSALRQKNNGYIGHKRCRGGLRGCPPQSRQPRPRARDSRALMTAVHPRTACGSAPACCDMAPGPVG